MPAEIALVLIALYLIATNDSNPKGGRGWK